MSLLMDALKRAELAKQEAARAQFGIPPNTPSESKLSLPDPESLPPQQLPRAPLLPAGSAAPCYLWRSTRSELRSDLRLRHALS